MRVIQLHFMVHAMTLVVAIIVSAANEASAQRGSEGSSGRNGGSYHSGHGDLGRSRDSGGGLPAGWYGRGVFKSGGNVSGGGGERAQGNGSARSYARSGQSSSGGGLGSVPGGWYGRSGYGGGVGGNRGYNGPANVSGYIARSYGGDNSVNHLLNDLARIYGRYLGYGYGGPHGGIGRLGRTTGNDNSGGGYYVKNVTAQLAAAAAGNAVLGVTIDAEYPTAAVIRAVTPGGPAEVSGLRPGDRIASVNERMVKSPSDLVNLVSSLRPGDRVEVQIVSPFPRAQVQRAAPEGLRVVR